MRILVLDDDDVRHRRFARWFAGFDVTHVHDCEKFEQALMSNPPFDYIFLDHDLNDNHYRSLVRIDGDNIEGYVGPCVKELNGQFAAGLIAQNPEKWPIVQIVVHSWNPPGVDLMLNILEKAGIEKKKLIRWEFNPDEDLKLT